MGYYLARRLRSALCALLLRYRCKKAPGALPLFTGRKQGTLLFCVAVRPFKKLL